MRVVYDKDIGLADLLAMSSEDDRSPRMILEEEEKWLRKALKQALRL